MNNSTRSLGVFVAGLLISATAFAQDWPQWRGANRDGKVTGFTAPQAWPKQLNEKWKAPVGLGDSSPALVGDRLYVFARQGGDEVTLCLDAATGKEIWRDKYAALAIGGPAASAHSGPRSSPAVAEGKVVTLGIAGVVSCLDAATGKSLWRNDQFTKTVPQFYTAYSPIIADGLAIVHLGGKGEGSLVAFDLASGAIKWQWSGEAPAYASPVLMTANDTRQIVALTEKSLVGIGLADGKLLWQVPFPAQGRAYNAATPIVDGQTIILSGQNRGTKAIKIEKQGDAFAAKELWANPQLAPQFNSPVLKDGLIFGLSGTGGLYCINAKTGQTAWTESGRLGGFGALVDAGPVLFLLPNNSELIVFKPNEAKYEEVARIKVADTPTYAYPLIAGNRVFVKAQQSLSLLTID